MVCITAGGENVPPAYIEDCIKSEVPSLSNVMMVVDKKFDLYGY